MKKSKLIEILQEIEDDFEMEIKTPGDYGLNVGNISVNEINETITIYSE